MKKSAYKYLLLHYKQLKNAHNYLTGLKSQAWFILPDTSPRSCNMSTFTEKIILIKIFEKSFVIIILLLCTIIRFLETKVQDHMLIGK